MTEVVLIAEDVRRLRAAYPEADAARLETLLVDAALSHRAHEIDPDDIVDLFIHEAAALAVYRRRLTAAKGELPDAVEKEAASYAEGIELDRDVIPPLKQEAQQLRGQIRESEARLRARGVDPRRERAVAACRSRAAPRTARRLLRPPARSSTGGVRHLPR